MSKSAFKDEFESILKKTPIFKGDSYACAKVLVGCEALIPETIGHPISESEQNALTHNFFLETLKIFPNSDLMNRKPGVVDPGTMAIYQAEDEKMQIANAAFGLTVKRVLTPQPM